MAIGQARIGRIEGMNLGKARVKCDNRTIRIARWLLTSLYKILHFARRLLYGSTMFGLTGSDDWLL